MVGGVKRKKETRQRGTNQHSKTTGAWPCLRNAERRVSEPGTCEITPTRIKTADFR